ncbi:MAG: iron-containing alcohol dehydrogenase [Anaerolineae bacterium]|jgi:alcohol dehydrogenase class IV|nr:iron-containing alcohol dehydrogenase [Anaerolineae bacterium]
MNFSFITADRIIFGPGTVSQVGSLADAMGSRAMVIAANDEKATLVLQALRAVRVESVILTVVHEPTTDLVRQGTGLAREAGCDVVIAIGGGSVIDTGKAIAALLTNGGDPLDYLEVIGRGLPIAKRSAPHIAIPTTAGTGAEVTANAVLASPEHRVKVSLRSPLILPHIALVDPELTHSVPPSITASTGLDAFTQVLEPYVSSAANPITDTFCREGLWRASESLLKAYEHCDDAAAREDMALVSLLGGLALANAKLGAVHGFAGVLGGMYDAPHGAICGRLLPFVMQANVSALLSREPRNPALARYDEIASILTGDFEATAQNGVAWTKKLCEKLAVPGLARYGVAREQFGEIVEKTQRASSMKGNPIKLTDAELAEVLARAL